MSDMTPRHDKARGDTLAALDQARFAVERFGRVPLETHQGLEGCFRELSAAYAEAEHLRLLSKGVE